MGGLRALLRLLTCTLPATGAGKFDAFDSCDKCIAAGLGWSFKKARCGGFPNKSCPPNTPPPPAPSNIVELTDKIFARELGAADVFLVNYYGPACAECNELKGTLEAAAAKLGEQMKIGRVDATAHPGEATDFGRLGKELPSLVLFRAAVKLEHYTGARDAEAIVAYMVKIAATDDNVDEDWDDDEDDEDEPEIMRFSMATAQGLMTHRLKNQLVIFMSKEHEEAGVAALEVAIKKGGYAEKVLGLHIPTDDPENNPVLERFFVNPDLTPSIRIAQMYPNGDGLRVFAPFGQDRPSNKMADGKLKTAEGMIQALKDHFDGKSKPLLRSQPRPGMSHAIIKDLVGNSVDRWLQASNTHALLLLYWEKCTHCESLMPAFEKVAARVQKANEQHKPEHEARITIGRIEATQNDIGHPRIYAGSYPMLYFVAADDKDFAVRIEVEEEEGMHTEAGIMEFLKDNTWMGLGPSKDEL